MIVIDAARNVAYKNACVAIKYCENINGLFQTDKKLSDQARVVFYAKDVDGQEAGFVEPLNVIEWAEGRTGIEIQVLRIQR
jgi:hypothetical protein